MELGPSVGSELGWDDGTVVEPTEGAELGAALGCALGLVKGVPLGEDDGLPLS